MANLFPTLWHTVCMSKLFVSMLATAAIVLPAGFQSSDLFKLRSVGSVQLSPDGSKIAYTISRSDSPKRPFGQLWIMIIARPDGSEKKYLAPLEGTNAPLPTTGRTVTWAPDGKQIAYVTAQPGPE